MRAEWIGIVLAAVLAFGCTRVRKVNDGAGGTSVQRDSGDDTDGGGYAGSNFTEGSAEDCRGAGHYESGKEGSYLPCCDGLREVFQQKAAYDGDGNRVCVDFLLRVYACVEGECGDGVCEVGEDKPCGCVQDCPGANWGNADEGGSGTDGGAGNANAAASHDGNSGDGGDDICSLPPVIGPCEALIPRFFFNADTGQCEQFNYGGCQGNANNFETIQQCRQACGGGVNDVCPNALPIHCGDRLNHNTNIQGRRDTWYGYDCSQRFESGREAIYVFRSNESCKTVMRLNGITVDIDLFLLDACDPGSCTVASSTPLDIQNIEKVEFQAEEGRSYFAVVDGYDEASGAYSIEVDCLSGTFADDYADGEWVMQVDRRWDHVAGNVQFPSDEINEEGYQHVDDGATYTLAVHAGWEHISVGDAPLLGELTASSVDSIGRLTYDLATGTFAGGRFVVWSEESGLQAELTIYGSGLPIISSERGTLTPKL
ncbi:MAG: BPTI/Kunitz domain-containing protein [Deltaproteobacteria bacterium]|nr:BPTI/Kunitz domain-containing protein [Deltaproteobacteria bacterium]